MLYEVEKRRNIMNERYFLPNEIVENNIKEGAKKANYPIIKMILFGILAGAFIAIGAQASGLATHAMTNPGLAKTVAGTIFPVGLMLIVVIGGQLFTGNCLIFMSVLDKKVTVAKMLLNWLVIWCSNMIGGVFISFLVYNSGQFDTNGGALGAYTIKVAASKMTLSPTEAICSGILCNIIVCGAILMAGAAKDITGKCVAIFFTIFAFVVSGFEHCVANMYYIVAGLFASHNNTYVEKAQELFGLADSQISSINVGNMFMKNLLPVTLGNIIGGALIIGGIFYFIHMKKEK